MPLVDQHSHHHVAASLDLAEIAETYLIAETGGRDPSEPTQPESGLRRTGEKNEDGSGENQNGRTQDPGGRGRPSEERRFIERRVVAGRLLEQQDQGTHQDEQNEGNEKRQRDGHRCCRQHLEETQDIEPATIASSL